MAVSPERALELGRQLLMEVGKTDCDTELARGLIRGGANLNMWNDDGDTALIVCAQFGHAAVARELLSNGAFPDPVAVEQAKIYEHWDIVRLIDDTVARQNREAAAAAEARAKQDGARRAFLKAGMPLEQTRAPKPILIFRTAKP